jgi:hypothetical protein
LHAGVVGVDVAVQAVQGTPRLAFVLEAFGMNVALLEIGVAVREAHGAHHAVAAQESVVSQLGRILVIRHRAIPRAVDLGGQRTLDHQVVYVAFDARRRIEAGKIHRLGKGCGHGSKGLWRAPICAAV